MRGVKRFLIANFVALLALGGTGYNFWYDHWRQSDDLVAAIVDFGYPTNFDSVSFKSKVGFANRGNRDAIVSRVAVNLSGLRSANGSTPLEWSSHSPVFVPAGEMVMDEFRFGSDILKLFDHPGVLERRIPIELVFEVLDSDGNYHAVSDTMGRCTYDGHSLVTKITDVLPRRLALLPSDVAPLERGRTLVHSKMEPFASTTMYRDELTGEWQVRYDAPADSGQAR